MTNVKVTSHGSQFKIYLNDLVHVSFIQTEFTGYQSWERGTDWYFIEFYFVDGNKITCEYGSRELWVSILKELDKYKF